jgi:hypothetical protein
MLAFSKGTPERLKIKSQYIFDLSGLSPLSFFDPKGLSTIREAAIGIHKLKFQTLSFELQTHKL